jgi:Fe-S cluster biogenesis protein NfuA
LLSFQFQVVLISRPSHTSHTYLFVLVLLRAGACGSCPSSTVTMRMGIEKRLMEKIPEIMEVEQVHEVGLCTIQLTHRA